ncbi:gp436 family protein [Thauera aromatica]|uniref:gp436 family protein n=1 Tax=Thauera aromatica TaxID=59405 RepID=UPI001FFCF7EA|nr:DUF1320 domain-containing protein [Thauera aromatica]MCK2095630.1 DUF1320 domain-containing protein [Thauera aromatica]
MTYATTADMVEHFGEREMVELTDRGEVPTGLIDEAVMQRALLCADAEIEGYLAVRYALPLPQVSDRLLHLACDIARYHLYPHEVSEHVKERYDAAVRVLREIAAGAVSLGLTGASTGGGDGAGLVEYVSAPRLFGRL